MTCARCSVAGAILLLLGASTPALAVPYASQVINTSGNTWEFVLNEAADSITVLRDSGNAVTLTSPTAGRHTFDMTGFSDFQIQVAKDAAEGWTELSDESNLHTYYQRPTGVVVNQDASSPYFGTVYVSHPQVFQNPPTLQLYPRSMGDGIYSLSANLIGVDLANGFAAQTDPDDISLAKVPSNWTVDQNGGSSPWQIALDEAGNLIASDYSNESGGIKYSSPDLVNGGLVLAYETGDREAGLPLADGGAELHGSIQSKPSVTGVVGQNLKVWAIDEDLDIDGNTFEPVDPCPTCGSQDGYSIWRWDVEDATSYTGDPVLEIASTPLDTGEVLWYDDGNLDGIVKDAHYEPQFDKFYLTQSRTHGNESGLIIVSADGVDGLTPTVEWASKQWSIDNGLDGNDSTHIQENPEDLSRGEGVQDIFRAVGSITISPDGTKMYVHRGQQFSPSDTPEDGDNPVLGSESDYAGSILVIPLDEDGLPVIEIDDNGTPGDTSDDRITNFESITIAGQSARDRIARVSLDAAGNVYSLSEVSHRLQVFSPGGNTLAVTTSDGLFSLVDPGAGLAGDYNSDGVVDAADYTLWRDGDLSADGDGSGVVDSEDYNIWVANYGASTAAPGAGVTTPEPTAIAMLLVATLPGLRRRR
ncbi:hypothetical protein Pla123a_15470 [Posidoniimonas polymericola]|uniref:Uncharacterized protein n=1 Tax=Posidoniimonas polymericola TaxID=2528002 RepID=A0A5C5YSI1_9BACT|nr:hypothetical protein [Posidoniimonas polymericola]TWT77751.1 hypothetical protein Pla123a_15470 [Posidoniimonas polymericola]